MNWYIQALKQYAVFSGRSRRKEFWFFALFHMLVALALGLVDMILGLGFLSLIYMLGAIVPSIAVSIRRLHDTGRSGWWILLGFVPVAGLILFVFLVLDSQPGPNEYGPNPKAMGRPAVGSPAAAV